MLYVGKALGGVRRVTWMLERSVPQRAPECAERPPIVRPQHATARAGPTSSAPVIPARVAKDWRKSPDETVTNYDRRDEIRPDTGQAAGQMVRLAREDLDVVNRARAEDPYPTQRDRGRRGSRSMQSARGREIPDWGCRGTEITSAHTGHSATDEDAAQRDRSSLVVAAIEPGGP